MDQWQFDEVCSWVEDLFRLGLAGIILAGAVSNHYSEPNMDDKKTIRLRADRALAHADALIEAVRKKDAPR